MGATLDETRLELAAQRARVRATAERLAVATRRAVDVPSRIREHPLQTGAIAAGLAFLVLGGPRRVARQVRRVVRGSDADRAYAALPASLQALVDATAPGRGEDREEARRRLALAVHAWREDPKNRRRAARLASEALSPPGPGRAFWSVVEIAGATGAGIVARRLVARWLAGEPLRPAPVQHARPSHPLSRPDSGSIPDREEPPPRYTGWSGQRGTSSGTARETETPAKRSS